MPTEVKWYGDELLKQVRDATPDGLFAGAQVLIGVAASRAPTGGSGDLAKSGYVAIVGKSTYRKDKMHNREVKPPKGGAVAGFAAFYARFIEYGTSKSAAKPFFRPAVDEMKDQIGSEIVVSIGKKIK